MDLNIWTKLIIFVCMTDVQSPNYVLHKFIAH